MKLRVGGTMEIDLNNAVAVTRDIHWVGFNERNSRLRCNPYVLVDGDESVLIDPGSIPDFHVVMRKTIDLVVPSSISTIIASHQDPDVCGNLPVVEDVIERSDLRIVAHRRTLRLIQHLGLSSELFAVDEHDYRLTLESGRVLEFVHTPYLHAPGAIATWDPRTRSLFTSDLFGAIGENTSLFAGPAFLEDMRPFHEAYMPSNALLRKGMERLEKLPIDRILPQHGAILEGDQVTKAIAFLKELRCGVDLEGA